MCLTANIGHKAHPLHVNQSDVSQTKKSNYNSNRFLPKMVSVIVIILIIVLSCSSLCILNIQKILKWMSL